MIKVATLSNSPVKIISSRVEKVLQNTHRLLPEARRMEAGPAGPSVVWYVNGDKTCI